MIKKAVILLILIVIAVAAVLFGRPLLFPAENTGTAEHQLLDKNQAIDYTSQVLLDSRLSQSQEKFPPGKRVVAGVTSHHIPAAESFIDKLYRQIQQANPDISSFVIVGPDHFGACGQDITITQKDFLTPFGLLENNHDLAKVWLENGAGEKDDCFAKEHSIGVQASFIKKYFPKAKVTPLLFSSLATREQATMLANVMAQTEPGALVICSTDFSHYESVKVANEIDTRTEKQLKDMDVANIKIEQVDSPASLNFTVAFVKSQQASLEFFDHANSYDFSGIPDNTTSYFDVIFAK